MGCAVDGGVDSSGGQILNAVHFMSVFTFNIQQYEMRNVRVYNSHGGCRAQCSSMSLSQNIIRDQCSVHLKWQLKQ